MSDCADGYKGVRTAVIIPTLCRNEHFEKCITSLARNPWAKYVDVYIGLDYPLKESHWPGYRKILEFLEGDFSMFGSFHVEKRESNYGPRKNIQELKQKAQEEHEQYIYSEDDNEFSENYLEYMLKALDFFRDDANVIAVSGYSYPVDFGRVGEKYNVVTENAIFNMWGAGFWFDKTAKYRKEIEEDLCLVRDFSSNIKRCRFSRYRKVDYINCVAGVNADDPDVLDMCPIFTRPTDMALGVYMEVNNKYQVMPVVSKVRNNGFDGSGLYCQDVNQKGVRKVTSDTYDYSSQPIDDANTFSFHYDSGRNREKVFRILDEFVDPGAKMMAQAAAKYAATAVIGKRKLAIMRLAKKIRNRGGN